MEGIGGERSENGKGESCRGLPMPENSHVYVCT